MSFDEEDPFWNNSGVKAFNFDDEEQLTTASQSDIQTKQTPATTSSPTYNIKTLNSILAPQNSSNKPFLKPSKIICNGSNIDLLLEYLDESIPQPTPVVPRQDPKAYIRDIVEKRLPIDFSPYKSKRDKLSLLDCAICSFDGNTITAATIFIYKTLKLSTFIEEMKKRPIAIDHFMNYLHITDKTREILDFNRKFSNVK